MDFLNTLDGTGREIFPIQREVLTWIASGWKEHRIQAIQLPTGTGKSFIARTIQRETGGVNIVSSNSLMTQVLESYPDVNFLKGQDHYQCERNEGTCADTRKLELPPCPGCPYRTCRKAALEGAPTYFNPMSLYYLIRESGFARPERSPVTIVDEAHTLLSMLLLVSGERFGAGRFKLPQTTDALEVVEWLRTQSEKCARAYDHYAEKRDTANASRAMRDISRLDMVCGFLEEDPANYSISFGHNHFRGVEKTLDVVPIVPPKSLIQSVLGNGKIVLMSATLSRLTASALSCGEAFAYLDMPSPIPAKQRPVYYRPAPHPMNAQTTPVAIADQIRKVLETTYGNTIVHVTYSLSAKLARYFPHAIRNTPETKAAAIARFKSEGGLFLASGCAEGLDLPDNECRVNIIPVLPRPNRGDAAVQKWLALPGGNERYDLEILKVLQQQVGRSTRHIGDHSKTFILDPGFAPLASRYAKQLPISFRDSIVWHKG